MNILTIYLVAKREVHRLLKRKALFFFILFAPGLSFLVLEYLFSAGSIREIPITVVDLDQSNLSRKIISSVEASPLVKIAEYSSDVKEAKSKIFRGEVSGALVIPEKLEKNVTSTEFAEVSVFANNSNLVLGGNLQSGIYKAIASINSNIKIKNNLKEGDYFTQAEAKAEPVSLDIHQLFNPFGNYAYFLVVGLLPVMLIVFTFLISIYALGSELKEATAGELMKTANNNIINAISGKYIPYTILFFVDAMIMNLIIFRILEAPFKGNIMVVLISEFLLIIAYQAIAVLFLAITNNMRLSLSLGSAYSLLSFSFSGLTYPFMAMPLIANIISWLFPYTFWLHIFLGESLRGQPLYSLRMDFIILIVFFLLGMLAFPNMKKRLTNPDQWGRR